MTYDEIRTAWNAQADDGNRWHSLSEAEKIEWAAIHAAAKERGPAPIFNSVGLRKLESLQRKGFHIVGYVMVRDDYNYLSQDANGNAWLYWEKPELSEDHWITTKGECAEANSHVSYIPGTCDWDDSLVARPEGA
jgi:hypothetical protein